MATPFNEIAAILVGKDGAEPAQRDIVVYHRDRETERISYMSCHIDPMCYPILFPRGDLGWHNGMQERKTASIYQSTNLNPGTTITSERLQCIMGVS